MSSLLLTSACFVGNEYSDASKQQVVSYLSACHIKGAQVEKGEGNGESAWVVNMGSQPKVKWDCFARQQEKDGVIATSWGTQTDR